MVRIVELRSQDRAPDAVFDADLASQPGLQAVAYIGLHGEMVGLEDAIGVFADRVGIKISFVVEDGQDYLCAASPDIFRLRGYIAAPKVITNSAAS